MRKLTELVGFLVGCVLLAAAFGVGWTNWGKLENQETIMQVLMAAILAVVVFLAVITGASKGRDRWRAMLLDNLLLLGFSVLLFDIGLHFSPLALVLLIFSLLNCDAATLNTLQVSVPGDAPRDHLGLLFNN